MDNNTRSFKKEKREHTANYIISRFLMSKYSRKKKYKLNLAKRGFMRYVADCIDLTFKKHKRFQAKVTQKQIATQNCGGLKTVWRLSKSLIDKKIFKFDEKKQIYSFGIALLAYVKMTHPKEVRQNDVGLRSTSKRRTSNSSNSSNTVSPENLENQRQKTVQEKIDDSKKAEEAKQLIRNLTKSMRRT